MIHGFSTKTNSHGSLNQMVSDVNSDYTRCRLILRLVNITKILHSRQGVETWLTSDGRTYFVQLHDITGAEGSASDLGAADDRTAVNTLILSAGLG